MSLMPKRALALCSAIALAGTCNAASIPTSTSDSSLLATIAGSVVTYSPQFTVPASADEGANLIPNIVDPEAKNSQDVCPGYTASNVVQNSYGLTANLVLAGPACNLYGNDVQNLKLTVEYQSATRLAVNISPSYVDRSNSSWFILPDSLIPRPSLEQNSTGNIVHNDFNFTWSNSPSFAFTITRKSTGDTIFSTAGTKLVYEDQFIEFVTSMPQEYNVFGLGEQINNFRLGNNYTATIWAADAGNPVDANIYGSHPFYLDTRYYEVDEHTGNRTLISGLNSNESSNVEGISHGVFLRNAHGQEVLLREKTITWRTLGGSIDLFFFTGPTQPEVTKQYQLGAIGLPAMQQYFTLGYHQCRWGYTNWTNLQEVVDNFAKFDIPLENIWTDIDYMKQYRDFEMDPNTFPVAEGKKFLDGLHAKHQHYIPIVDSALYIPDPHNATDAYPTYDRGNQSDVFLKNADGSQYIGAVWPGYTVFPDWHADKSVDWWSGEMSRWHNDISFSGIWIDMSEASSFCIGSCGTGNLTLNPVHPPFLLPGEPGNLILDYPEGFNITNATEASSVSSLAASQSSATATPAPSTSTSASYVRTTPTPGVRNVELPPYVINNINGQLGTHAVAPNATHADGVQEYDVHNLFGHQILNATYQALLGVFPGKRPFIIGRSTFAGSGKWAGHWGGDNNSKWPWMYFSIPQALHFSLFGIPMFGVDTCGFTGNTDAELCARWMQLSAFFPFYRNHNEISTISQEPYVWSSVAEATRQAMAIRYALLPYMYTLFHQAHTTGSTVMRALAWEFSNDPSLAAADRQFLLGPALMVTPVLSQGASSVNGVFPGIGQGTIWYDWYTQTAVSAAPRENKTISAPVGHIPVYVRGGYVLPMQQPGYTTYESRRNPWNLLVALGANGTAAGELYVDDGESLVPNATLSVTFSVRSSSLAVSVSGAYKDTNPLANVTVLGVASAASSVAMNGLNITGAAVSYNSTSRALSISGLQDATAGGAWSRSWTLNWS